MRSMALNQSTWDLELDSNGNWYLADQNLSVAQDVACAWKVFLGECWYDNTLGLPYLQSIFGQLPPSSLVVAKLRDQAFTIADVKEVRIVSLQLNPDRSMSGQGVITTDYNDTPIVVTI